MASGPSCPVPAQDFGRPKPASEAPDHHGGRRPGTAGPTPTAHPTTLPPRAVPPWPDERRDPGVVQPTGSRPLEPRGLEVISDQDEILVVVDLHPGPARPTTRTRTTVRPPSGRGSDRTCASSGRASRDERMALARSARRPSAARSRGAPAIGDVMVIFTTASVPVMTRLRLPGAPGARHLDRRRGGPEPERGPGLVRPSGWRQRAGVDRRASRRLRRPSSPSGTGGRVAGPARSDRGRRRAGPSGRAPKPATPAWQLRRRDLFGFEVIQGLGQGVPREGGAFDPHGELDHSLQGLQVPEGHLGRRPGRRRRRSPRPPRHRPSPSPGPSRRCSWIDIIDLNLRIVARVSARLLPLTAVDIIDADDWLIEQPWPVSLRPPAISSSCR